LELILETLGRHGRTIAEACQALGLSEAQFHRLRNRALAGALEALEPRAVGRPPRQVTPEQERIAELEAELGAMKVELRAAEIREELALVWPSSPRRGGPPQISVRCSSGRKKKRRGQVR
jgi:transposase